jgi:hypothetical protein
MSLKLRGRLARGWGSMVHYSPVIRDGLPRATVTLLVTIADFGREDPEEASSQPTEKK